MQKVGITAILHKLMTVHERDNVGVLLHSVDKNSVHYGELKVEHDLPVGHKLALCRITPGEKVYKYGFPIGVATQLINAGEHVHSHNLKTGLSGLLDYTYNPVAQSWKQSESGGMSDHFQGYRRYDGAVAIRNEVWIVNTVGCCNKISELLTSKASTRFDGRNVDGIYQFSHPYGCSQLGDDLSRTQKVLAGLVRHPNAAAVLVLGLGCENNNLEQFRRIVGEQDERRVRWLNAQDVADEIETGLHMLDDLVDFAETFSREPIPIAKLVVGLKCGGSDAFSGITANPLVGYFSDHLVSQGGTVLLTEVPEMFGAETILMNRCRNERVFKKTVSLINNFKLYFKRYGQEIYENPSPGNKDGGITTLEEKSLGCIQKGGSSYVNDVVAYGDTIASTDQKGLILLDGPGNDMVALTALAAAGAHLVLFTTGRGTPLGGPVPTIKIASNSELAKLKKRWIDFDAGRLLFDTSMPRLSEEFFDYVLAVASGDSKTKNESHNFREIAIFKDGVTL